MPNKITAQVGQIIEVNGKQYRATESGFELITVKRGPLGGELVSLLEAPCGVPLYGKFTKHPYSSGYYKLEHPNGHYMSFGKDEIDQETGLIFEVNIPPRPTFTPMTAGEAAKLPDIVGRWVAVRVDSAEPAFSSTMLAIGYGGPLGEFFRHNTPILLIEGVDL